MPAVGVHLHIELSHSVLTWLLLLHLAIIMNSANSVSAQRMCGEE
jgi:hypothetical protein